MSEKQKDEIVDNIESLKSKFNVQTQELTKALEVEQVYLRMKWRVFCLILLEIRLLLNQLQLW